MLGRNLAQVIKPHFIFILLLRRGLVLVATLGPGLLPQYSWACQSSNDNNDNEGQADRSESKHLLGIIPNNRTSPSLKTYQPITSGKKFKLAADDAFDRGNFALAALFAAESQLTDSNPSFGQGAKGYAQYFATSFADLAIGDFMTEAIFPTLLHQDPRYFRRGSGSGRSRLGYAASQVFITHGDSGRTGFNFSEIVGNSTAVAIAQAYYPDNRNAVDASMKLGTQIAVDMVGNILKEFWPDMNRKFFSKRHPSRHP